MSLSTHLLRPANGLLLPLGGKTEGSVTPSKRRASSTAKRDEFARLKHLSGCSGLTRNSLQKLIKEDHFLACTTRMFEIRRPAHKAGHLDRSKRAVHSASGPHILAASDYSLVKELGLVLRRTFAKVRPKTSPKPRWQLSLPSSVFPVRGGGIISAVLPLSTGCREKIFRHFCGRFHRRKAVRRSFYRPIAPKDLTGPNDTQTRFHFTCVLPSYCSQQRAINISIAAVQSTATNVNRW